MSIGFKGHGARVAAALATVLGLTAVSGPVRVGPIRGEGYTPDVLGQSGMRARMVRKNRRLARHGRRK